MYDGKLEKGMGHLLFEQMKTLAIEGDLLDGQNINISNGDIYLGRKNFIAGQNPSSITFRYVPVE